MSPLVGIMKVKAKILQTQLSITLLLFSLHVSHQFYPQGLKSFLSSDINSETREQFNLKVTIIPSQMSSFLIAQYIITEKSSKRLRIKTLFFFKIMIL